MPITRRPARRPPGRSLEPSENELIREIIQQLLDQHGTQENVAKLLGIKQSAVSSYLRGVWTGGIPLAKSVASVLGTPVCEILGWHDEKDPTEDPLPARRIAIAAGARVGVGPKAVAALRRETPNQETTALEWLERLVRLERTLPTATIAKASTAKSAKRH